MAHRPLYYADIDPLAAAVIVRAHSSLMSDIEELQVAVRAGAVHELESTRSHHLAMTELLFRNLGGLSADDRQIISAELYDAAAWLASA